MIPINYDVYKREGKQVARVVNALFLVCFVAACSSGSVKTAAAPLVGADRDAHGCIPSAGYVWCAREGSCVRPWELAQREGFAYVDGAFDAWCSVSQKKTTHGGRF